MQKQTSNKEFEETLDNYESLYFKALEFKEDFMYQIISSSQLLHDYYNKSEKINTLYNSFLNIEKNRKNLRESINKFI